MNELEFNKQLCDFIGSATTPFHAVAELTRCLEAGGFVRLDETAVREPKAGDRYFVTRNDSSTSPLCAAASRLP